MDILISTITICCFQNTVLCVNVCFVACDSHVMRDERHSKATSGSEVTECRLALDSMVLLLYSVSQNSFAAAAR